MAVFLLGAYLKTQYVVPVLMYHAIDEMNPDTGEEWRGTEWNWRWGLAPESFARQVEFLVHHDYSIVSLDIVAGLFESGGPIPAKTVVLTFDDGLVSVYDHAFPVLKRWNVPAIFFITTSFVGTPGYVTWEQVREMQAAGVTIGSHSVTHPELPECDEAILRHEIFDSKAELERQLGVPVRHFSYPHGNYNDHTQQLVREAGYRTACATLPYAGFGTPNNDLYAIKRVNISRKSRAANLPIFWFNCSGYYMWLKERGDWLWGQLPR